MHLSKIKLFNIGLLLTLSQIAAGQGVPIASAEIFFAGHHGDTVTQTFSFLMYIRR